MISRDAEQAVIGALIANPEQVLPEAAGALAGDDFLIPEYRNIYTACMRLYDGNKPVDSLTVLSALDPAYKPVVAEAVAAAPTVSHFREYIMLVAEASKRVKACETARDVTDMLESGEPLEECQNRAAEMCRLLADQKGTRELNAREGFIRFMETKMRPKAYLKTGFGKLDKYTYIDRGDYIIVGARPSAGKTALTLQMMLYMAREHNVVYFSLETSGEKLFDRLAANVTKTPLGQIKQGTVENWAPIAESFDYFKNLHFTLVDAAGWTVRQIRAKAMQLRAEIIFIDYLSLIRDSAKSLYERVTNISMDLHTLAQQNRVTVIALSQLNREGKGDPDMTSLRESGQIEQDADVVLLLHNTDQNVSNADRRLIIAKNKEGRTGRIDLAFSGEFQRFSEYETRYEE